MKKLPVVCTLICLLMASCRHHDGNIEIRYTDADQYYTMKADFKKGNTRAVERYMNQQMGAASNMSFVNTNSDAEITMDDHTKFYMKKSPGHMEIKINKADNSDRAYRHIKAMCEGMKTIMMK